MSLYETLMLAIAITQLIINIITLLFHRRNKENEYGRSRHASLKALTQPFFRSKKIIDLK